MSFQSELNELIDIREIAERKIAKLVFETIIKPVVEKEDLELRWHLKRHYFAKNNVRVELGQVFDALVVCAQIVTKLNIKDEDPIRWIMMTLSPNAWYYNKTDGFFNKGVDYGNGRKT